MELYLPYCSMFLICIQMAQNWIEKSKMKGGGERQKEKAGWRDGKKKNKGEREEKQINKTKVLNKHWLAA